jgi:hypothetical protein
MALNNFKGTVWSDAIQAALEQQLVAGALVNTSYQGELGRNTTVRINKISALSVEDYDGVTPLSPETLASTTVDIVVDQAKAVAFKLDDVDAAQATPALLAAATREAAVAMAAEMESHLIGKMSDAATSLGNKELSATYGAWDVLMDLLVAQDNANVPSTDRFVIVSPAFAAKLAADSRLNRGTVAGDAVARTGFVGEAAGYAVYKSVNIATDTVVAGHTVGCAFVQQVNTTEAVRSGDFFADVVRTLSVYGAKVIRTEVFKKASWSIEA